MTGRSGASAARASRWRTRFPIAEAQRVRLIPMLAYFARIASAAATSASSPRVSRVSSSASPPTASATASLKCALSLAIHVAAGGGAST